MTDTPAHDLTPTHTAAKETSMTKTVEEAQAEVDRLTQHLQQLKDQKNPPTHEVRSTWHALDLAQEALFAARYAAHLEARA